mgnify:CR=1 FL=1
MKDEMKGETRDELKDGTEDDAMLMKVLGVFVGTLVLGWILLNMLPFGYVESAVLFKVLFLGGKFKRGVKPRPIGHHKRLALMRQGLPNFLGYKGHKGVQER